MSWQSREGRVGRCRSEPCVAGFKSPACSLMPIEPQPPYLSVTRVPAASAGAHAMLDVSDGPVTDLGHIADASVASISTRHGSPLMIRCDAAVAFNADPRVGSAYGDDHAIVAVFPRSGAAA